MGDIDSTVARRLAEDYGKVDLALGDGDIDELQLELALDTARPSRYVLYLKPVIDRVAGLLLMTAFLPLLLGVAVAVYVSMGRPLLFRQHRMGAHGELFTIYKFRTMRPDRRRTNETFDGPERREYHKSEADPRHTAVGRFLRRYSLDELPQLLNVLKGDMSLVGPRPELPLIVARYAPWQHRRHDVKPGITGLWQVSARGDGHMHEHVQIDIDYVEKVSLWLDLKILASTLPAALGKRVGF